MKILGYGFGSATPLASGTSLSMVLVPGSSVAMLLARLSSPMIVPLGATPCCADLPGGWWSKISAVPTGHASMAERSRERRHSPVALSCSSERPLSREEVAQEEPVSAESLAKRTAERFLQCLALPDKQSSRADPAALLGRLEASASSRALPAT